MTERERLIEMINNSNACICVDVDKITDYLLQNGVIVPPCKVGDTVYFVTDRNRSYKDYEIIETTVTKVGKKGRGSFFQMRINSIYETSVSAFGKNVFLTREEAEKALKELKEE